ncbi:MAG: DUF3276 family protein [Tepidisphaeraceae bacterium]
MTTATRPDSRARNKSQRASGRSARLNPGDSRNGDTRNGDSRNGDSRLGDSRSGDSRAGDSRAGEAVQSSRAPKPEAKIVFQKFFKSVGPRTYAAQVKELPNGNHLLVLTEGKRDKETGEIRKTRVFLYGEDFTAFFRMLGETAAFLRAHPLPEEVRKRRDKFWATRRNAE